MARFNQARLLFLLAELCRLPTTRRGQTQLGGQSVLMAGRVHSARLDCAFGLRVAGNTKGQPTGHDFQFTD